MKLYRESDQIDPFKKYDYVEVRQQAFEQKNQRDDEVRQKEGLSPGKRANIGVPRQAKRFDVEYNDPKRVYPSPAPKLGKHIRKNSSY